MSPQKSPVLKSQRNGILLILKENNLIPSEFIWHEVMGHGTRDLLISRLTHKPTDGYFLFDYHKKKHFAEFCPGPTKYLNTVYPGSWEYQLKCVREWAQSLNRELSAPDLWKTFSQEQKMIDVASPEMPNSSFTEAERLTISKKLTEIKKYLLAVQGMDKKHQAHVEKGIDYLIDATNRLGRKDWIGMVIATCMGWAFSRILSLELVRHMWGMIYSGLSEFYKFSMQLP
jgi:hypothetical protein